MLTVAQLAQARAAQEAIMTATCAIHEPGEGWIWDPDTQTEVPAPGAVVYAGPCRWQRAADAQVVVAGEQGLTVGRYVGAIPWHVVDVTDKMTLEVTASDDPALLGSYALTEVEASSFVTCRRLHGVRH